jgi:hypothetical protein
MELPKKPYDKKKNYFVSYADNWADEMDISGNTVMNGEDMNEYIKTVIAKFKEDGQYTFYVGTNEDINYDSLESFLSSLDVTEISNAEIKILEKFGLCGSGHFPDFC